MCPLGVFVGFYMGMSKEYVTELIINLIMKKKEYKFQKIEKGDKGFSFELIIFWNLSVPVTVRP